MRVGLTGGVASGKSTVAALLDSLGAVVVDADLLAREVVVPGSAGLSQIVEEFGAGVLHESGTLDRPRLGQLVFADPEARRRLEAIVHPLVRARATEIESGAPEGSVVVHDIPLLVETGQTGSFDAVLVVDVPVQTQVDRMVRERAMSDPDAWARVAAQASREQRLEAATHVVENTGTHEDLREKVTEVFGELTGQRRGTA